MLSLLDHSYGIRRRYTEAQSESPAPRKLEHLAGNVVIRWGDNWRLCPVDLCFENAFELWATYALGFLRGFCYTESCRCLDARVAPRDWITLSSTVIVKHEDIQLHTEATIHHLKLLGMPRNDRPFAVQERCVGFGGRNRSQSLNFDAMAPGRWAKADQEQHLTPLFESALKHRHLLSALGYPLRPYGAL